MHTQSENNTYPTISIQAVLCQRVFVFYALPTAEAQSCHVHILILSDVYTRQDHAMDVHCLTAQASVSTSHEREGIHTKELLVEGRFETCSSSCVCPAAALHEQEGERGRCSSGGPPTSVAGRPASVLRACASVRPTLPTADTPSATREVSSAGNRGPAATFQPPNCRLGGWVAAGPRLSGWPQAPHAGLELGLGLGLEMQLGLELGL